ncbi:MAG: glycosyltransferase family 39 protein [Candidatus Omnitrophota bacterium]
MNFEKLALLILVGTVFFHALVNFYILDQSRLLRENDEEGYIYESIEFYQKLISGQPEYGAIATGLWHEYSSRGFIHYAEGLILIFLNKIDLKDVNLMIVLTNAFFLLILLIATYKIGSLLYNKKVGLLAAVLLSFSPQLFSHLRLNMLDFPVAAMVSLFFLCLLKTNRLTSTFFSLLSGIIFMLAEATKETAVIFIFPVVLFYFFTSLSFREKRKRRVINFIIIFILLFSRVAMVYFCNNRFLMRYGLWKIFWKNNAGDIFYYIKSIPLYYFGLILSIALILPLFSYALNIRKRNKFLFSWLFIPFLLFSFSINKTSRFLLPALPPFFLLLIAELFTRVSKFRRVYIPILFALAIFQYAILSFFPNLSALYPKFEMGLLSIKKDPEFYKFERLMSIFAQEQSLSSKKNRVVFTAYTSYSNVLDYEFKIKNMPFFVDRSQREILTNLNPPRIKDLRKYLLTADYVVDNTDAPWECAGPLEEMTRALKENLRLNYKMYIKIGGFNIENKKSINVYKRIKKYGAAS